jgi:hypothetical protein
MARKSISPKSFKAIGRLRTLRSVYETPQSLRRRFGLRRRKLSASQKLLRVFAR